MIFDTLENLKKYLKSEDYQKIKFFLDTVSPDMLVSLYTVQVVLETLGAEDYEIYNVVTGRCYV